jgi:two-component system, NarL family, nitrate/nitrite sensor histidine kinase NarX
MPNIHPNNPAGTKRKAIGTSELYAPLAGLSFIFISIILSSFGVYFWPTHQDIFFVTQLALTGTGLFLISRISRCVKARFLTPLTLVREWAQRMQNGDLAARVPQPEQGEFADLAKDINKLGESLRSLTREMDEQVHRQTITLQRKTRSLEILYDVAAHSNSAKDIDELLITFLNTLTEIVYAHAGTVRLVTDDHQMRLVGSVGLDQEAIEKIRFVPIERCLCAQEFSKNMLLCQNHFNNCNNVVSELLFAGDKLENIAIPLRYNNRTLGIYNLFVEKLGLTEREDIKDILANIGQHLSMAIAKSHWEEESHRLSIMQERTMLAHELHDSLAQTLASLSFRVSLLQKTLQEDYSGTDRRKNEASKEVDQIKIGLDDANFELRELLSHFRIRMDERGLIPAAEDLINGFRKQGNIQVFFQNECPDLRLPPMLEVHLLHIMQESLTNIRKHSNAKHVRVLLSCNENQHIYLLIEDDGMGIVADISDAEPGEHVGLTIMRERAQRIGAELTIESDPGEGTRIELELRQADHNDPTTLRPNMMNTH